MTASTPYVPRNFFTVTATPFWLAAANHRISRVRVFGSVARGADGPDSDPDLLVDFEPEASLFDQADFAGEVEDLLGVGVDVVSAESLTPPRDRNILRDARDL